jgi:hypothetical protein
MSIIGDGHFYDHHDTEMDFQLIANLLLTKDGCELAIPPDFMSGQTKANSDFRNVFTRFDKTHERKRMPN